MLADRSRVVAIVAGCAFGGCGACPADDRLPPPGSDRAWAESAAGQRVARAIGRGPASVGDVFAVLASGGVVQASGEGAFAVELPIPPADCAAARRMLEQAWPFPVWTDAVTHHRASLTADCALRIERYLDVPTWVAVLPIGLVGQPAARLGELGAAMPGLDGGSTSTHLEAELVDGRITEIRFHATGSPATAFAAARAVAARYGVVIAEVGDELRTRVGAQPVAVFAAAAPCTPCPPSPHDAAVEIVARELPR